jgi:monofunctional biosynthetic peptidoglycan transglycosylase
VAKPPTKVAQKSNFTWWQRLKRWILLGVLTGVLLSVIAVLPWRWIAPPTSAFMLAEYWQTDRAIDYRWRPLERISPQLAIAVVASEDQKFPDHHGFDLDSIMDALSAKRTQTRGASTISQQVAKNLYLWGGRSYLRKGIEAYLTLLIESLWPKRRILEVYLNVAEFAPGIYGAEAASRRLFGKPANQLTLTDSSLLAAVLPNPKRMQATLPSDYVSKRAQDIRQEVRQLGGQNYLTFLKYAR